MAAEGTAQSKIHTPVPESTEEADAAEILLGENVN